MLHVFLAAAILAGHPAAHNASPCVTRTFNYSITQGSPILGPFYGRAYYAAFPSWGYGWTSYCGTGYWGGFTVPAVYGPIVWGLPYHPIYSNHPYWGPVPVRVQTYRFSGSPRPPRGSNERSDGRGVGAGGSEAASPDRGHRRRGGHLLRK